MMLMEVFSDIDIQRGEKEMHLDIWNCKIATCILARNTEYIVMEKYIKITLFQNGLT